jgi:FkbM family methyltransferase
MEFIYNINKLSNKIILYGSGGMASDLLNKISLKKKVIIVDDFNHGKFYKYKRFITKIYKPSIINKFNDFNLIITNRFYKNIARKIKRAHFLYFLRVEKKKYVIKKKDLTRTKLMKIKFVRSKLGNFSKRILSLSLNFRKNTVKGYKAFHNFLIKYPYKDQYLSFVPKKIGYLVDVGFHNCESTKRYLDRYKNIKRIYAIDPNPKNFKGIKNLIVKKIGLSNKDKISKFYLNEKSSSGNSLLKVGKKFLNIHLKKLDNVINFLPINSIIKFDIEGAELNALKGCKNLITKFKPYLAISIYHRKWDIVEIPMYMIKNYNNIYKFKIRHYSYGYNETVLYCIPKNSQRNVF